MIKIIFLAIIPFLSAFGSAAAQTPFVVGVPDFSVSAPRVELAAWPWGEKDWPTRRCARLSEELRQTERGILELKVRYWASRLSAEGAIGLLSNPGSEIRDGGLRKEFFLRLGARLEAARFAAPTRSEVEGLREAMRSQWTLIDRCGGQDEELRRAYEQIVAT